LAIEILEKIDDKHIQELQKNNQFFWLDLDSSGETEVDYLSQLLHLHPLSIEASKEFGQRPKLTTYDNYALLIFYGANGEEFVADKNLLSEVHVYISAKSIITVHQQAIPALIELKKNIASSTKSDAFSIYEVLDSLVDSYFPILDSLSDQIEDLENRIIEHSSKDNLSEVFKLKKSFIQLRRIVIPQRDLFARSVEEITQVSGLEADANDYFRDIYDHLIRISDLVDNYRDLLSGCTDLYLSMVANKQGEISKQLTIIASIFLPLSLISGIAGENFTALTGHLFTHAWAFWIFNVGLSVIVAIGMVVWFKKKGWIGSDS
jgi:magnesium transporter